MARAKFFLSNQSCGESLSIIPWSNKKDNNDLTGGHLKISDQAGQCAHLMTGWWEVLEDNYLLIQWWEVLEDNWRKCFLCAKLRFEVERSQSFSNFNLRIYCNSLHLSSEVVIVYKKVKKLMFANWYKRILKLIGPCVLIDDWMRHVPQSNMCKSYYIISQGGTCYNLHKSPNPNQIAWMWNWVYWRMQKIAESLKMLPTITGRGALLWKAGKTGLKHKISLISYQDIISMKQRI